MVNSKKLVGLLERREKEFRERAEKFRDSPLGKHCLDAADLTNDAKHRLVDLSEAVETYLSGKKEERDAFQEALQHHLDRAGASPKTDADALILANQLKGMATLADVYALLERQDNLHDLALPLLDYLVEIVSDNNLGFGGHVARETAIFTAHAIPGLGIIVAGIVGLNNLRTFKGDQWNATHHVMSYLDLYCKTLSEWLTRADELIQRLNR